MDSKYENLFNIIDLENQSLALDIEGWMKYTLLTFDWWLLLLFLLIPWIIWGRFVDRNRIIEILLLGLMTIIITTSLDLIGAKLNYWMYPTRLVPIIPIGSLPFDAAMVPVAFMLIYQSFTPWKTYSIALICISVVYAFIGEPFAVWRELVLYVKWNYTYSFIFYILMGICVKALMEKLKTLNRPISINGTKE